MNSTLEGEQEEIREKGSSGRRRLSDEPVHPIEQGMGPAALEFTIILPAHNEIQLLASTVGKVLAGFSERRPFHFEIIIVEETGRPMAHSVLLAYSPHRSQKFASLLSRLETMEPRFEADFEAGARGACVVNFDVDYCDLNFVDSARSLLDKGNDIVLASKNEQKEARDRAITSSTYPHCTEVFLFVRFLISK